MCSRPSSYSSIADPLPSRQAVLLKRKEELQLPLKRYNNDKVKLGAFLVVQLCRALALSLRSLRRIEAHLAREGEEETLGRGEAGRTRQSNAQPRSATHQSGPSAQGGLSTYPASHRSSADSLSFTRRISPSSSLMLTPRASPFTSATSKPRVISAPWPRLLWRRIRRSPTRKRSSPRVSFGPSRCRAHSKLTLSHSSRSHRSHLHALPKSQGADAGGCHGARGCRGGDRGRGQQIPRRA